MAEAKQLSGTGASAVVLLDENRFDLTRPDARHTFTIEYFEFWIPPPSKIGRPSKRNGTPGMSNTPS